MTLPYTWVFGCATGTDTPCPYLDVQVVRGFISSRRNTRYSISKSNGGKDGSRSPIMCPTACLRNHLLRLLEMDDSRCSCPDRPKFKLMCSSQAQPPPSRLSSPNLCRVCAHQVVVVAQVRSRRAHILKPMDGWASLSTENGYRILESVQRPTKYKVCWCTHAWCVVENVWYTCQDTCCRWCWCCWCCCYCCFCCLFESEAKK